jgi:hypothetical protein
MTGEANIAQALSPAPVACLLQLGRGPGRRPIPARSKDDGSITPAS